MISTPALAQEYRQSITTAELDFASSQSGLRSNSIFDIVVHENRIWLGTGKGLSLSEDNGRTWRTFTHNDGLGRGGVSALAVNDTMIWVATIFDSLTADAGTLPAGGGLAYSKDFGENWQHVEQPGPTPVQNNTFDIALHDDGSVWIASFGGGLQRTFDLGQTWEVIPPDENPFDPLNFLNHRAFSAISANGVLWVGTADGVNKSLDDGETWTNFNHANQPAPISGDFVVALKSQVWDGVEYLWAATRDAEEEEEERGVSVSEDGGLSWRTSLQGVFAHNFAVDGSVVYVATDMGVYKSLDFGHTWARYPDIADAQQGARYFSSDFFAVAVSAGSTLWVGGPDGLAKTMNDGLTWQIQRGSVQPGENGEPRTYAYPSPFSPFRHNKIGGGDGHIRFQYNTANETSVTIRVYDFAMRLVAEIVAGKSRPANGSFFEAWNGRNARNEIVANGVYFYSVQLEGDGVYWNKFMVID
jgi:ligand-binding sensor domain-containing protein